MLYDCARSSPQPPVGHPLCGAVASVPCCVIDRDMASIVGLEWSAVPTAPASLIVSKDGLEVESHDIGARPYTILGRNPTMSHVPMEHESLSRQHAAVAFDADGVVYLVDLNSRHGTFLNGQKLSPLQRMRLSAADSFKLGGSSRVLSVRTAAAPLLPQADGDMPPPPPRMPKRAPSGPINGSSSANAAESSTEPADGFLPRVRASASVASSSVRSTSSASSVWEAAPEGAAMSRQAREAEIAAMVASLKAPVQFSPLPPAPPHTSDGVPAVSSSGPTTGHIATGATGPGSRVSSMHHIAPHAFEMVGKEGVRAPDAPLPVPAPSTGAHGSSEEGGEDEAVDDDEEGGGEAAAMAMAGLPVNFGRADDRKKQREGGGGAAGGAGVNEAAFHAAKRARIGEDGSSAATSRSHTNHTDGHASDSDGGDEGEGEGSSGVDSSTVADALRLPVSHEVVLAGHSKTVSVFASDVAGARLVTGSLDYSIRLYDFGGMDRTHKSFRDVMPQDGHPVIAVDFSPTGDRFVVGTTSSKAVVYDRDGNLLKKFIKGDMYISDVSSTKGHVGALTAAMWHPVDREYVVTASIDSSIRFWNLNGKTIFDDLVCGDVIRFKNSRGLKAAVTAATFSRDGRVVFGATDDGSLQLFNVKGAGHKYLRPDSWVKSGHKGGESAVTSLSLSPSGVHIASRGTDETVKVWDLRKFDDKSGPVLTIAGLATMHSTANTSWNADGSLLIAGSDGGRGKGDGLVHIWRVGEGGEPCIDAATGALYTIAVCKGAPAVCVHWHHKINQIMVGCGDAATRVLYDPRYSSKGALLSTARAPKKRDEMDTFSLTAVGKIYTPHALPMFREEPIAGQKRRFGDTKGDKAPGVAPAGVAAKPELPTAADPDFIHAYAKTFTQYFVQNSMGSSNIREQDPTEILRGYAEKGATEATQLRAAYATTQPKPILAERTIEEEEEQANAEMDAFLRGNVAGK